MDKWIFDDHDKVVDLDSAIKWVLDIHDEEPDFIDIIHRDEDTYMGRLHHGFGTWLRNTLGLWDPESSIVKWFGEHGIYHGDDISSIILLSAYRKYHNQDIKLDEQIKHYRDYWEKTSPEVNQGIRK